MGLIVGRTRTDRDSSSSYLRKSGCIVLLLLSWALGHFYFSSSALLFLSQLHRAAERSVGIREVYVYVTLSAPRFTVSALELFFELFYELLEESSG